MRKCTTYRATWVTRALALVLVVRSATTMRNTVACTIPATVLAMVSHHLSYLPFYIYSISISSLYIGSTTGFDTTGTTPNIGDEKESRDNSKGAASALTALTATTSLLLTLLVTLYSSCS